MNDMMLFESTWMNVVAAIVILLVVASAMIELGKRGTQRDDFRRGGRYNK